MATVHEVPADILIRETAKDLKTRIKQPGWSITVKTGTHAERRPDDPDWWWIRAASVLRKIYIHGPIGVEQLRVGYGGRKHRGVKPEEFRKAGGKIIRSILQEFDGLGFTEKDKSKRGRRITPKGKSYLDKIASKIEDVRSGGTKKEKA